MAAKKKMPAKRAKVPAKHRASTKMNAESKQAFSDRTVQLLILCFTFLSLTFAVMAYWRYT